MHHLRQALIVVEDVNLGPLRGRAGTVRQLAGEISVALGIDEPHVRFVDTPGESYAGLLDGDPTRPCVEISVDSLRGHSDLEMLGVIGHELGHIAAGHLAHPVTFRGWRRWARYIAREHEADLAAAAVVGIEPLEAVHAEAVTAALRELYGPPARNTTGPPQPTHTIPVGRSCASAASLAHTKDPSRSATGNFTGDPRPGSASWSPRLEVLLCGRPQGTGVDGLGGDVVEGTLGSVDLDDDVGDLDVLARARVEDVSQLGERPVRPRSLLRPQHHGAADRGARCSGSGGVCGVSSCLGAPRRPCARTATEYIHSAVAIR